MLLVLLVCTTPVVIWNAQNDWITVRHLIERTGLVDPPTGAERGGGGIPLKPGDFLAYYGMHLGVYSPLIFLGLTAALVLSVRRFFATEAELFIGAFCLPVTLGYFALSLFNMGELNWTAPGFVGISLLLAHYWPNWRVFGLPKRPLVATAYGLAIAMTLWACNPDLLRSAGLSWPYSRDPQWRLRGWETLSAELEKPIRRFAEESGQDIFLITNRYQMATPSAFYLPRDLPVLQPSPAYPFVQMREAPTIHAKTQFSFWPSYDQPEAPGIENPFLGRNALFFTDEVDRESPPTVVRDAFEDTELYVWFTATRHGLPVRSWKVFACRNFLGPAKKTSP